MRYTSRIEMCVLIFSLSPFGIEYYSHDQRNLVLWLKFIRFSLSIFIHLYHLLVAYLYDGRRVDFESID